MDGIVHRVAESHDWVTSTFQYAELFAGRAKAVVESESQLNSNPPSVHNFFHSLMCIGPKNIPQ